MVRSTIYFSLGEKTMNEVYIKALEEIESTPAIYFKTLVLGNKYINFNINSSFYISEEPAEHNIECIAGKTYLKYHIIREIKKKIENNLSNNEFF